MIQVVKQTKEEKIAMYKKLPKKQLIEMLIECNILMDSFIASHVEPIYKLTEDETKILYSTMLRIRKSKPTISGRK